MARRILSFVIPLCLFPALVAFGVCFLGDRKYVFISLMGAVLTLLLFFCGISGKSNTAGADYIRRRIASRRLVLTALLTALTAVGRLIPFFKPITAITTLTALYLGRVRGVFFLPHGRVDGAVERWFLAFSLSRRPCHSHSAHDPVCGVECAVLILVPQAVCRKAHPDPSEIRNIGVSRENKPCRRLLRRCFFTDSVVYYPKKTEDRIMIEVAGALIWQDGKFLICQRPPQKKRGLLWEFVGGKLEAGESGEIALARECREELGIAVAVGEKFLDVVHDYPDVTVHLTVYRATILSGTPQLLEHVAMRYITPEEIPEYAFCPADEPILQRIREGYRSL